MSSPSKHVAVIGAGPAGLMAAEVLAQGGASVTVYDAMPSAGRKFLMAGRGGLNLTHSEPLPAVSRALPRGDAASGSCDRSISAASACATGARRWGSRLSSAPAAAFSQKPSRPRRCCGPGCGGWIRWACSLVLRHRWTGWDEQGRLLFQTPDGPRAVETHATVLALGGASWPRLGSDGAWAEMLAAKGVTISPLRPANSGFTVAWSDIFRDRFEGQPLKGVALSFGPHTRAWRSHHHPHRHRGRRGLCAVGRIARGDPARGQATLHIALRPDLETGELIAKLSAPKGKQSFSNFLRKAAQSLARRDRPVAGGGQSIRRVVVVAVA